MWGMTRHPSYGGIKAIGIAAAMILSVITAPRALSSIRHHYLSRAPDHFHTSRFSSSSMETFSAFMFLSLLIITESYA
jgi:hypothetical protein